MYANAAPSACASFPTVERGISYVETSYSFWGEILTCSLLENFPLWCQSTFGDAIDSSVDGGDQMSGRALNHPESRRQSVDSLSLPNPLCTH